MDFLTKAESFLALGDQGKNYSCEANAADGKSNCLGVIRLKVMREERNCLVCQKAFYVSNILQLNVGPTRIT